VGVATGRRAYVSRIDAERAEVVISTAEADLSGRSLRASGVSWISEQPDLPARVEAQIRYRHRAAPASVIGAGAGRIEVTFDEPQNAITPGQAVVLYDGDRVLGGGWIE
jgi:tRNA-specific 2-thiouridylase